MPDKYLVSSASEGAHQEGFLRVGIEDVESGRKLCQLAPEFQECRPSPQNGQKTRLAANFADPAQGEKVNGHGDGLKGLTQSADRKERDLTIFGVVLDDVQKR